VQHGSYTYTAPDGSIITVTYTADEQGFRAQGAHLPTPPPIPAEIQKSLDIIYEQIRLQQVSEQCVLIIQNLYPLRLNLGRKSN
jgi:Insect cuticle protein.